MAGLHVGGKALITGSRTWRGKKHIGKVVTLALFLEKDVPSVYDSLLVTVKEDSFVVEGNVDCLTVKGDVCEGFCIVACRFLMPMDDIDTKYFEKEREKERV